MVTKKQHYVPRFYLKHFAKQDNGQYFVNCFDKSTFNKFKVNIKDVACENYFYEISDLANNALERMLSDFESQIVKIYEKIIFSESLACLKWTEKTVFAQFVLLQESRTRERREHIRDMVEGLEKWLSDKPLSEKMLKEWKNLGSEEGIRRVQLMLVAETLLKKDKQVDILLNMKWSLLKNLTKIPFWTSDNPITRYNPYTYGPYGSLGMLNTGIQIFFPLTPKIGITFYDPIEYSHMSATEICDKDNLLFYNTLQLMTTTRHIFSSNADFFIAKKWLTENPSMRAVNRNRVSTEPNIPKNYNHDDYKYDPVFRYFRKC